MSISVMRCNLLSSAAFGRARKMVSEIGRVCKKSRFNTPVCRGALVLEPAHDNYVVVDAAEDWKLARERMVTCAATSAATSTATSRRHARERTATSPCCGDEVVTTASMFVVQCGKTSSAIVLSYLPHLAIGECVSYFLQLALAIQCRATICMATTVGKNL